MNFDDFSSLFSSPFTPYVLVSIEKIYLTLEAVFDRLFKYLEFFQKYSAARRIFNFLLCVRIS